MRTWTAPREVATRFSSAEGGAETRGVDPPVVVLAPVDEGDRHLVAEAAFEVGRAGDGHLGVRLPQLCADVLDDGARVVAQVAPGTGVEQDAGLAHSSRPRERRRSRPRSRPFCTLPVTVSGSSSTISIRDGCLKRASRTPQWSRTSAATSSGLRPWPGTTYATT